MKNTEITIWTDPLYFTVSYNKVRTLDDVVFNATFNQTIDLILRQTVSILKSGFVQSSSNDIFEGSTHYFDSR